MKKLIALILTFVLVLSLAGCGDKPYYSEDMTKYITVGKYSNVIDRNSEDYKAACDAFYTECFGTAFDKKITEGKVQMDDVANIDYVGKLDGKAFEGGTDSGYDLTIGSGQFIKGFEEGLVGVEIGDTVSLDLTFPENYGSKDLAGKDVVFDVTVNHVTRKTELTDDNIVRYGFASLKDYETKADDYALKVCLLYNIYDATTFNKYPQKETNVMFDNTMSYFEDYCKSNNISLEKFASANGFTLDEFKEYINEHEIKNNMNFYMVVYYVLQQNNAQLTQEDIEAKRAELDKQYDETLQDVGYYEINIQQAAAYDKALECLAGKAEAKN